MLSPVQTADYSYRITHESQAPLSHTLLRDVHQHHACLHGLQHHLLAGLRRPCQAVVLLELQPGKICSKCAQAVEHHVQRQYHRREHRGSRATPDMATQQGIDGWLVPRKIASWLTFNAELRISRTQ